MELQEEFREYNVTVTSINTDGLVSPIKKLQSVIEKNPGNWFVDELILPKPSDHPDLILQIHQLVLYMKSLPNNPRLWIAVAGMYKGKSEHFKYQYLQSLLVNFYFPGLNIPLREALKN